MEELPILSMVPVALMEDGSYTARGHLSSCLNTSRSLSLQHPPLSLLEEEVTNDLDPLQRQPLDTTQTTADMLPYCAPSSSSRDMQRMTTDLQQTTTTTTTYFSAEALKHMGDSESLDIHLGNETTESSSRSELLLSTSRSRYYECPVYEGGPDSSPKSPVLTIFLPAGDKGANYWVQRRVAMYLNKH